MTEQDLTQVLHGDYLFVIMNAPTDKNIYSYCKKLDELNISTIVRVCEPTYSTDHCSEFDIEVKDFPFSDGAAPPEEIINNWLNIVEKQKTVAVHCVAGLGRAPVLVVIALIEFGGMEPLDAISVVRDQRRGAINRKQLTYLNSYKPRQKANRDDDCCCIL